MAQSKGKSAFWAAIVFYILAICVLPFLSPVQAAEKGSEDLGTVIGIDLGTTYSLVSC